MKERKPFFSILVPVYGVEEFLPAFLESVDGLQGDDFELILTDDGGKDACPRLLDEYAAAHHFAKVIHQENEGTFLARIRALSKARGEWLLFPDSDDLLHPKLLSKLSGHIAEYDPDVISFNASYKSDFSSKDTPISLSPGLYEGALLSKVRAETAVGHMNSIWSKCVRRELLESVSYDRKYLGLTYTEDWLMSAMIVDRARSVLVTDDILYCYRTRSSSAVHSYRLGTAARYKRAWDLLAEIAARWGEDFSPGFAAEAAAGILRFERFASFLPGGDAERAKLVELFERFRLSDMKASDPVSHYHRFVVRSFLEGRDTAVRLLAKLYFGLKQEEEVFRKLKNFMSGN